LPASGFAIISRRSLQGTYENITAERVVESEKDTFTKVEKKENETYSKNEEVSSTPREATAS
jgi:hypothetical protein